jgi:hypothetical protein
MPFEPAASALGNLIFGQGGKETSGWPAFLVGQGGGQCILLTGSGMSFRLPLSIRFAAETFL